MNYIRKLAKARGIKGILSYDECLAFFGSDALILVNDIRDDLAVISEIYMTALTKNGAEFGGFVRFDRIGDENWHDYVQSSAERAIAYIEKYYKMYSKSVAFELYVQLK